MPNEPSLSPTYLRATGGEEAPSTGAVMAPRGAHSTGGVGSASGKQLHKSPAESSEQKVMLTFPPVGARPTEGLILPSYRHGPAGLEQEGLGSPR